MKALKITLLFGLFLTVSSQTDKTPATQESITKEIKTEKPTQTEFDLLAHIVTGIRIPTQG